MTADYTWLVMLRSKHTGREQILGDRYATEAEATEAGKAECDRCNQVVIQPDYAAYHRANQS